MYSVAIQVNLFQNNMADKTVWRINRGRINEYSLYTDSETLLINPITEAKKTTNKLLKNILKMKKDVGMTSPKSEGTR